MWVVTFLYENQLVEDEISGWSHALELVGGSADVVPGVGHAVTLWVESPDPIDAAVRAEGRAAEFARGRLLGVEALHERAYVPGRRPPRLLGRSAGAEPGE